MPAPAPLDKSRASQPGPVAALLLRLQAGVSDAQASRALLLEVEQEQLAGVAVELATSAPRLLAVTALEGGVLLIRYHFEVEALLFTIVTPIRGAGLISIASCSPLYYPAARREHEIAAEHDLEVWEPPS